MLIPKPMFDDFCLFWKSAFGNINKRKEPIRGEWARSMYRGRLVVVREHEDNDDAETLEVFCPERSFMDEIEKVWASFVQAMVVGESHEESDNRTRV